MLGKFLQRPAIKALLPLVALALLLVGGWIITSRAPNANATSRVVDARNAFDAAAARSKRAADDLQKTKVAAGSAKQKAQTQHRIATAASAASKASQQEKAAKAALDNESEVARREVAGSSHFAWYGVLALGLLWLISAVFAGDPNPVALAMGADNRLSTSKMQLLVWTACVGFIYAMVYADRVLVYGKVQAITNIPDNVLFALGISATSALVANAITSSQVSAKPTDKIGPPDPSYDPAALVRDDGAQTASLNKVQILFWTAVAVIAYATNAMHGLGSLAACTPSCGFPDIDTTLMIFMGLGHASYLGGKIVQTKPPALKGDSGDAATTDDSSAQPASGAADALSDGVQQAPQQISSGSAMPRVGLAVERSAMLSTAADHVRVRGIDISEYNGRIDWDAAVKRGGIDFVYAQATYGSVPPKDDAEFDRNHDECKRLGIPFGAYHFLRFPHPGDEQARHFLQRIDGRFGTLIPMVDVENDSGDGDSFAARIACLSSFCEVVEKALGSKVVIYTNQSTWNAKMTGTDAFAGHPLWVANYTGRPDVAPAMPGGWKAWAIYQYSQSGSALPVTSTAKIAGLDLDVLPGTIDDILLKPIAPPSVVTTTDGPISPGTGTGSGANIPQPTKPATTGRLASVVYNGVSHKLKGFDASGAMLFAFDARNDSVSHKAWRPDAGCPPGSYTLHNAESNDPAKPCTEANNWIGEGRWFIPLTGIPGHDGIGIHGGGTCVTPPDSNALRPRQGWCATENCIRVQNEDLENLAGRRLEGIRIRVVQQS